MGFLKNLLIALVYKGFPGIASHVSAFVTGKKHGAVKEDTGDLGASGSFVSWGWPQQLIFTSSHVYADGVKHGVRTSKFGMFYNWPFQTETMAVMGGVFLANDSRLWALLLSWPPVPALPSAHEILWTNLLKDGGEGAHEVGSKYNLFINLFNKHLESAYYVPDTVPSGLYIFMHLIFIITLWENSGRRGSPSRSQVRTW